MKYSLKAFFLCLVLLLCLLITACPKRTSIGEIEANPGKFNEKTVAIAGKVKTSYGASIPIINQSGGIYKIDDGTGEIWVITQKSVPSKDALLGIKGKIQNGVNYNGKNYGLVLIEDDRRFKKN